MELIERARQCVTPISGAKPELDEGQELRGGFSKGQFGASQICIVQATLSGDLSRSKLGCALRASLRVFGRCCAVCSPRSDTGCVHHHQGHFVGSRVHDSKTQLWNRAGV